MRSPSLLAVWLGLLLVAASPASIAASGLSTQSLRLCVKDQPFLPYTSPSGTGLFQLRVLQAAKQLSIEVTFVALPWRRCLRAIELGEVDATIGMVAPERLSYVAYPLRGNRPDSSRSVGKMHFGIVKRADKDVAWDGKRLQLANGETIGVQRGINSTFGALLRDSGVSIDSTGFSAQHLLNKLAHGRHAAVVVQLASQAEPRSVVELPPDTEWMPHPYASFDAHLLVAKSYRRAHPEVVEGLWNALRSPAPASSKLTGSSKNGRDCRHRA